MRPICSRLIFYFTLLGLGLPLMASAQATQRDSVAKDSLVLRTLEISVGLEVVSFLGPAGAPLRRDRHLLVDYARWVAIPERLFGFQYGARLDLRWSPPMTEFQFVPQPGEQRQRYAELTALAHFRTYLPRLWGTSNFYIDVGLGLRVDNLARFQVFESLRPVYPVMELGLGVWQPLTDELQMTVFAGWFDLNVNRRRNFSFRQNLEFSAGRRAYLRVGLGRNF